MSAIEIVLIVLVGLSMLLSLLSTILVFAWRHTTPEIADLRTSMIGLSLDQATIVDKFKAYMAREDARNARRGKKKREKQEDDEEQYVDNVVAAPVTETKDQLRTRVFATRRANVALD